MSIFGSTNDADYRRWQLQKLTALTALVKLAAEERLPALAWRLPRAGGALLGEVDPYGGGQSHRDMFDTWCTALAEHPRIAPLGLGLRHDQPPVSEHTFSDGKTRLKAGFTYHLTDRSHPRVDFVVTAEWWDDQTTTDTQH